MNVRSFINAVTVLVVVLFLCLAAGLAFMRYALVQVELAGERQVTSLRLARETSDNSFNLTADVRNYVASGDAAFKGAYLDILAVRSGQKARPGSAAVAPGRQVPLGDLYDEAGFTEGEKRLLAQANELSGALAQLETEAMEKVEAAPPDKLAEAREAALKLLYGQDYQNAAAAIQVPVGQFEKELAGRLDGFKAQSLNLAKAVQIALFALLGLAAVIAAVAVVWLRREVLGALGRVASELADKSQELNLASGQLSSASSELAEGATRNAASLEEIHSSLEDLSKTTKGNAESSGEANGLMAEAADKIGEANASMRDVIKAMEDIDALGGRIGDIIKTIDEIAFQTNLLALNASVEAARAGEAGAGFAVVADEVRNLALRSAESAHDTSDLVDTTVSSITTGTKLVNGTAGDFQAVSERAAKAAEILAGVAEASRDQSMQIEQIAKAIAQVDEVTQSNAASSEESSSAAISLTEQASSLAQIVAGLNKLLGR